MLCLILLSSLFIYAMMVMMKEQREYMAENQKVTAERMTEKDAMMERVYKSYERISDTTTAALKDNAKAMTECVTLMQRMNERNRS